MQSRTIGTFGIDFARRSSHLYLDSRENSREQRRFGELMPTGKELSVLERLLLGENSTERAGVGHSCREFRTADFNAYPLE